MKNKIKNDSKPRPWYRWLINFYTVSASAFLVWMIFYDDNSYFIHNETDEEIYALEQDKIYYNNLLQKESVELKNLKTDPMEAERIARERYYMHKRDENVYLIEQKDSNEIKR